MRDIDDRPTLVHPDTEPVGATAKHHVGDRTFSGTSGPEPNAMDLASTIALPDLPDVAETARRIALWHGTQVGFAMALSTFGDWPRALRHFGLTRWEAGDPGLAAEVFATGLSLAPDDAFLWCDLAGALNAQGMISEAEACLRRSLAILPAQPTAWVTLAGLRQGAADQQQAEAAFRTALAFDPGLAAAHFGLGLLCFAQRRLDEALIALRAAAAQAGADVFVQSSLGQVAFIVGAFDECVSAFARAASCQPLDASSTRRYAQAVMITAIIAGDLGLGLSRYRAITGDDAPEPIAAVRDVFAILSAFGPREAAATAGVWLLAREPDHPVQRYLVDAVRGEPLLRAPDDYLERYFDQFAPAFDKQLVEVLRYDAPAAMAQALRRFETRRRSILDLGCGTGLAAEAFRGFGARVTGLDISGAMLDLAGQRGVYATLLKSEAVVFLQSQSQAFDCIVAADMLVYVGDLAPLIAGAAGALVPGGYLVASFEAAVSGDFTVLPSGRFAHTIGYIERIVGVGFDILAVHDIVVRLEANRAVAGFIVVARRRMD